jgi:hypothetical protein
MSQDREQRISKALASLVDKLLPDLDDEEHENAVDLGKSILDR